jgi:hypothetical protein
VPSLIETKAVMYVDMDIQECFNFIAEEGRRRGVNLLDNYNWRTEFVGDALKAGPFPDLVLNRKRTGVDAWTTVLRDIEIKTSKSPKGNFMWDKQNDPLRRAKTLESEAFVFAIFNECSLSAVYVAQSSDTVGNVRSLLAQKQEEFLVHMAANQQLGIRGNDAISLTLRQLLTGGFTWEVYQAHSGWRSVLF